MAGPWEKFKAPTKEVPQDGPWQKFAVPAAKEGPSRSATIASSVIRPMLEIGGGVAGGALGAGLAAPTIGGVPAGAIAGGALGIAGGKAAADLMDEKLGIKEAPETIKEAAIQTGEDLKYGAEGELLGRAAAVPLQAGIKGAVAVGKSVASKAKDFAVNLTPASILQSKPIGLFESALEKMPLSSGMIQRFRIKQGQQLEKAAQDLIEQFGTSQGKETVGTAVQEAIQAKHYKRLMVRNKLFDRLTASVKPEVKIGTENLQTTAEQLLANESQLPVEAQSAGISKFLDSMAKIRQQGLSFKGAKALRERLSSLVGPMADTPEKQVYKQLKNSLDDDLAKFADEEGGEIGKAWKKANSFHGAVKQLASDPNIKSVLDKANPSAVVNSLFNSRNTLQLRLLRKAMPESSYQNLQGAMINRLFEGGVNQTASEALASNIGKYGDEFLEVAVTKQKLNRLKEFAEVVQSVKAPERLAGNPSGTAQNVISFASGAYVITNPLTGVAVVATPPALAKIYLSDFGRKLITEGVRLSPQSARAAGVASALAALAMKNEVMKDEK